MSVQKPCKYCKEPEPQHFPFQCRLNPKVIARINTPQKPRRAIKKKGKRTLEYEDWRDNVAKPYLDKKYGRKCAACGGARCGNKQLDVDHIENRGSHPSLRMSLDNVQYLGRYPCHQEKTDGIAKNISENY